VRFLGGLVLVAAVAVPIVLGVGHGPDFPIEWTRDVPSKLALEDLEPALRNLRNWPVFFHDLKKVERVSPPAPAGDVTAFDQPAPGSQLLFELSPKGKEWKRYTVRAEVTASEPGRRVAFRLLEDSTGKTSRAVEDLEWGFSVRPADGEWAAKGYKSVIHGEARARTKGTRSRFFARIAGKGLMNQLFGIDLVRLANFVENRETWARDYAPVYK
jgi:hypothetical protein